MKTTDFLGVRDISQVLGVSYWTVQKWIRDGELPAIKAGRSYRVRREDFDAWRQNRTVRPDPVDIAQECDDDMANLYQAWLQDLSNGTRPCSEATVTTHRAHFMKYVRLVMEAAPKAKLTYQLAFNEKSLGAVLLSIPATQFATRYNTYSAAMNFTKFLVKRSLVENQTREAMKVHRPKRLVPPKKTVLYSMEEVNTFLDAILLTNAYTHHEKLLNTALVGVMVFAGLRVTEVAMLELANLDQHNRLIHVQHAKGGHPRIVGINQRLMKMLSDYLKVRPNNGQRRLFLSLAGTPLNKNLIDRRVRLISKRSGLKVTPHGLRRTFATLNANAGRSLNLIQLALGHRDISTTQEYLMADNRMAAQQMRDW